ncbi:MAG: Arc family DNA-binding protein [Lachnospiraceae bacterium]|nr:Arc family DNA-binding protein [Lachnospiraceae bacterium]
MKGKPQKDILRSLAEYEGRSINGEVLYLIRQAVKKHEANNK